MCPSCETADGLDGNGIQKNNGHTAVNGNGDGASSRLFGNSHKGASL